MGVLDGKAAVVTGGGRGIGRGHCLHLAAAGAAVVVNDVDIGEARAVVDEIGAHGGRACASDADIGSRQGAEQLIAQCATAYGKIDALVNNAGIARDRSFLKMTDGEFDDVMRIHLYGTFWCSQAAARRMQEQGTGGAIVNTTSAAHFGNFGQTNYAAAKGGIASLTYTLAIELARYGIRVNAISPLGTTRMSAAVMGDSKAPFIDPSLNGPMVAFLCSDEADYITGQIFGTGGDRIVLLEQPKYGHRMIKPGGWSLEDIRAHFKNNLGNALEPVGLFKNPYPFYAGVKPPGTTERA
ncbi:MAG: SDR family NAD(P)-dependent oxidoreductase [Candidatus Binatia bacterium]